MYRFLVIIEKGENNYGAYSPDLPGCVAVGDTRGSRKEHARSNRNAFRRNDRRSRAYSYTTVNGSIYGCSYS